jgi:hypothetical protein
LTCGHWMIPLDDNATTKVLPSNGCGRCSRHRNEEYHSHREHRRKPSIRTRSFSGSTYPLQAIHPDERTSQHRPQCFASAWVKFCVRIQHHPPRVASPLESFIHSTRG